MIEEWKIKLECSRTYKFLLKPERYIFHRLIDPIDHVLRVIVCKTPSDNEGFQGSLAAELSDDICL